MAKYALTPPPRGKSRNYRRFSVSGSITPRRKSVTWAVLEDTTIEMQFAATLIAAAAACRLPRPPGSSCVLSVA